MSKTYTRNEILRMMDRLALKIAWHKPSVEMEYYYMEYLALGYEIDAFIDEPPIGSWLDDENNENNN